MHLYTVLDKLCVWSYESRQFPEANTIIIWWVGWCGEIYWKRQVITCSGVLHNVGIYEEPEFEHRWISRPTARHVPALVRVCIEYCQNVIALDNLRFLASSNGIERETSSSGFHKGNKLVQLGEILQSGKSVYVSHSEEGRSCGQKGAWHVTMRVSCCIQLRFLPFLIPVVFWNCKLLKPPVYPCMQSDLL